MRDGIISLVTLQRVLFQGKLSSTFMYLLVLRLDSRIVNDQGDYETIIDESLCVYT